MNSKLTVQVQVSLQALCAMCNRVLKSYARQLADIWDKSYTEDFLNDIIRFALKILDE